MGAGPYGGVIVPVVIMVVGRGHAPSDASRDARKCWSCPHLGSFRSRIMPTGRKVWQLMSTLISRLAEGIRRHGAFQTARAAAETFFADLAKVANEIAQLSPEKIETSEVAKAWTETIGKAPNGFGRLIVAFGRFASLPNTVSSLAGSQPFTNYYGAFQLLMEKEVDAVEVALATAKTQKNAYTLLQRIGKETKSKDELTNEQYQVQMDKVSQTWFDHAAKVCALDTLTPEGRKFLERLVAMSNLASAKLGVTA